MKLIVTIISNLKALIGGPDSVTRKTVEGGVWTLVSSLAYRVLGLARTIVLARLLAPDDFGLFGIAAAVLAGFNLFTETSVSAMLIQKRDVDKRFWNTGWSIAAVRGTLLCLVLWGMGGFLGDFYGRMDLVVVLRALSLSCLFQGFSNIELVDLQKRMRFGKRIAIAQLSEIAGNLAAVAVGVVYRSVWALVVWKLTASLTSLVCSYVFLSFRPKFVIDRGALREFFSFGHPLLVATVLMYLVTNVDDLIVGRIVGITALGYYAMAYGIANLPAINISRMIARVTFPAFSMIKEDRKRVEGAFTRVFGYNALICAPVSIGLLLVAPEIISVVLGEKWLPMLPCFRVLCLLGLFRATASIFGPLITGLGRTDYLRNIKIVEFLFFAPLIYPSAKYGGIVGVSILTTAIYLLSLVMHMGCARRLLPNLLPSCIRVMGVVMCNLAGMALVVGLAKYLCCRYGSVASLVASVLCGGLFYMPLSLYFVSRSLTRRADDHGNTADP